MTNLTDEQILEFCHAEEVWVWDDDPKAAVNGKPDAYIIDATNPFSITQYAARFRHFSLEKPVVYEDGKWYSAKLKSEAGLPGLSKSMFLFVEAEKGFKTVDKFGVSILSEKRLTNIRRIPEELWEGDG